MAPLYAYSGDMQGLRPPHDFQHVAKKKLWQRSGFLQEVQPNGMDISYQLRKINYMQDNASHRGKKPRRDQGQSS